MKLGLILIFLSFGVFAQSAEDYFQKFESKVYSLPIKGVKDVVLDVESSKLLKQVNDQQSFGKVKELTFRVYWTATPERLAIEVLGLPMGFVELKDELKAAISIELDKVFPIPHLKRFSNYKFSIGQSSREYLAVDKTGVAAIPSFTFKFDQDEKLAEVIGHRPVGTVVTKPNYEKTSFSDGKWVLKNEEMVNTEPGGSLKITKEYSYDKVQGLSVLSEIDIRIEQKSMNEKNEIKVTDTIELKNYKINEGLALKYFLGESEQIKSSTIKK